MRWKSQLSIWLLTSLVTGTSAWAALIDNGDGTISDDVTESAARSADVSESSITSNEPTESAATLSADTPVRPDPSPVNVPAVRSFAPRSMSPVTFTTPSGPAPGVGPATYPGVRSLHAYV